MIDAQTFRHEKENLYGKLTLIVGGLFWLMLLLFTAGSVLILLAPIGIGLFIVSRLMRAVVFGNCVRITEQQFPEINALIQECAADFGLREAPMAFVLNSQGSTNALAAKVLGDSYILLFSELIDLMEASGNRDKLKAIIGHELAHHALGHVDFWKNLLRKPAYFIPFLGAAYSRSCELTADRIATAWVGKKDECKEALVILACGSDRLAKSVNVEAFALQEAQVPALIGLIHELFATHPRMTRRIIELDNYFTTDMGPSIPVTDPVTV